MKKRFLDIVYKELAFSEGSLVSVTNFPSASINQKEWLDKGEWLLAGKRAGAEKIFFVNNNPVVVFAKCSKGNRELFERYSRLWSLARPRILFLETEGELSVFDLAQKPIPWQGDDCSEEHPKLLALTRLKDINDVVSVLQTYHRDNIESGKVFEQHRFGDLKHRADQSLIADLKVVRKELINAGLNGDKKTKHAHALIGRSIFIRYLEDRGVLDKDYFQKVARQKAGWTDLLNNPTPRDGLDFSSTASLYPRVLQDKEFTYALYEALAKDFNGDMFPNVGKEELCVKKKHLNLIQDLLYGAVGVQQKLFFFSYKFDVIPLELISAIYEEFYHSGSSDSEKKSKARQDGAFYTPPVLAEFTISRVLTKEILRKNPRILDPACGSGIFLVEAFRRIARYKWKQKKVVLEFDELKKILRTQILGIEVNEEAARITAFSLYLALLHYLDPSSIQEHIRRKNKLPNLLNLGKTSANHFNTIHVENAFEVSSKDLGEVDVIVGNPPWGAPGNKADADTKERQQKMLSWCKSKGYPIGDKEPSQAFLWLATTLLKKGGHCALLTPVGVLFKHYSQTFRNEWINKIHLIEVFNFNHVRKFFFNGANSPFVMIHFTKAEQKNHPVEYWSAKQVVSLKETQSILFSKYDRTYLVREDLTDIKTWKTGFFGSTFDLRFIKNLLPLPKIKTITTLAGNGFKFAQKVKDLDWLSEFHWLPVKHFSKYGCIKDKLIPFSKDQQVEHRGKDANLYRGERILFKEGISRHEHLKVRMETQKYAVNDSIYSLRFNADCRVILGILWSSFTKYYLFMTSGAWTDYHDKVLLVELLQLPLPSKLEGRDSKTVVSIVEKLQNYHPHEYSILSPNGVPEAEIEAQRRAWEKELDEAVFDLYGFTEEQRNLIRDCCEITLPFFYKPYTSVGAMPVIEQEDISWIQEYAEIFARRWQPYLNDGEVLRADVHIGASGSMVAVEFYPADGDDEWDLTPKENLWSHILKELGKNLPRPMGTSQILLDGVVHFVSDDSVIIIKRNEKRFWTRSLAREDAEASLCKRMIETMHQDRGAE